MHWRFRRYSAARRVRNIALLIKEAIYGGRSLSPFPLRKVSPPAHLGNIWRRVFPDGCMCLPTRRSTDIFFAGLIFPLPFPAYL